MRLLFKAAIAAVALTGAGAGAANAQSLISDPTLSTLPYSVDYPGSIPWTANTYSEGATYGYTEPSTPGPFTTWTATDTTGTGVYSQSNTSTSPWTNGNMPIGAGFMTGSYTTLTYVGGGFTPGVEYEVTFDYNSAVKSERDSPAFIFGLAGESTSESFNDVTPMANGFYTYSYVFTEESLGDSLSFINTGDGTIFITNVNVSVVPEPMSLALLATGIAGVAMARRRRDGTVAI